jgi:hypothetical protein
MHEPFFAAGNRAVARLLQRDVGWTDASKQGRAWNADEREVGTVRRIPLEGLAEGMQKDRAKTQGGTESTAIPALSPESATGKAIVLVPDGLDATQKIEVLVFLHGFTESEQSRPFAGWRELDNPAAGMDKLDKPHAERMRRFRQGLDQSELPPGAEDTAPVRDVALDQAEQQLQQSGQRQLVIVLPQGGLHSQFGKAGDTNFDAGPYCDEIVTRLLAEGRWHDGQGQAVKKAPDIGRLSMGGHSGAGATLSHMADESVKEAEAAKSGKAPDPKAKKPASSGITGDLVLMDAINGTQLTSFEAWAEMRLDEDLAFLTGDATEDEKHAYLKSAPKLRGFTTDAYVDQYVKLDKDITKWFSRHAGKLGAFAPCLRANFSIEYIDVAHEELMRGAPAGSKRPAGAGGILEAINSLHPALLASTDDCSSMPEPLEQRVKDRKAEEEKEKKELKKKS